MPMTVIKAPADRGWTWIEDAWSLFRKNPFLWLGVTFAFMILSYFLASLQSFSLSGILFTLPIQLFLSLVSIGITRLVIDLRRGQKPTLETFQRPFRQTSIFPRILGVLCLCFVGPFIFFGLLWLINYSLNVTTNDLINVFNLLKNKMPYLISGMMANILIINAVLILVFLLFFMAMVSFASNLIGIYECTLSEALVLSLKAHIKNILPFTLLFVILTLSLILCVLTLGLGFLIFFPITQIIYSLLIDDLFKKIGEEASGPTPQELETSPQPF